MKSGKIMAMVKGVWAFCSYLFVPQWGKHPKDAGTTEDLSLFDYDIYAKIASRCETNHFHILLESKLKWPFTRNNKRVKGLFIHEYIHYIQHLSTLCGISLSANHNKMFLAYRDYFEHHDTIELPLLLGESNPEIKKFFEYFESIKGSRSYDNRIDKISVKPEDIDKARKGKTAVPVSTFNQETNQWDNYNPLFVGYYSIVESMADMMQRLFDPKVKHNESPYLVVQKVCEAVFPEVSKDYRMMIALCTCALMDSNPGVGLFDAIEFAKQRPGVNGYYMYAHYVQECKIKLPDGKKISILEMFNRRLSDYKDTLNLVFGGNLGYYGKAIDNAIIGAETGRNMLLSLLYDDSIPIDDYIKKLADFYGYPYIEAYNLTLWPGQKNRAIDVAVAIGFELLYKRFVSKNNTECPRADNCRRNNAYEYECRFDQWAHHGPCPFTAAMHYFHLEGKTFEQKEIVK